MKRKRKIILIVIIVLIIILGLWISGIIPKQIARISATNYLKNNFPEKQYKYVNIEWASSFGGYVITFKDEKDKRASFIMVDKYWPVNPTQGTNALLESYNVEYKGISDINDFYIHSITDGYTDLRTLPKDYSIEQAQKDNCFVIGTTIFNDNLYSEFMDKYNKKECAVAHSFLLHNPGRNTREIKYIRVSQNNASGYRHNFQLQVQKCQGSYDSHRHRPRSFRYGHNSRRLSLRQSFPLSLWHCRDTDDLFA